MIETISTSSVQSSALRQPPQGNSSLQAEVAASSSANLPSMRIRVDNQLDRAIIEVRSSDSEIVRQYPTEAQLRAFARAEALKAARQHAERAQQNLAFSGVSVGQGGSSSTPKAEVRVLQVQQAAPVAGAAPASDVSVALNSGATSPQSIEV